MSAKPYRFTPDVQEAFLALIRLGNRPFAAARSVGVDPRTAQAFAKKNPDFADRLRLAHHEAAEPIEANLYQAAVEHKEPWAIKMWLAAYNPDQWGAKPQQLQVSGTVTHELEGTPLEKLQALQERAFERQDALELTEATEAEIIEEDND